MCRIHRGARHQSHMSEFVTPLADLGEKSQADDGNRHEGFQNQDEAGAAAVDYLRVIGHLCFATSGADGAHRAGADRRRRRQGRSLLHRQAQHARFYFQRLLPETAYHIRAARSGAKNVMETPGGAVLRQPDNE